MKKRMTSAAVDKFLESSMKHLNRSDRYRHTLKEKKLFWYLMQKHKFKFDQELADFLYTSTPVISQVRNDKKPFSSKLILITYDKTNLTIEDIRRMAKEDV